MSQLRTEEPPEFIDEDPMTVRELEQALLPYLTRSQRRGAITALKRAGLIVFRADPIDLDPALR